MSIYRVESSSVYCFIAWYKIVQYIINIINTFVYNIGLNLINDIPVLCGSRNTVELSINFCSTVI